MQNELTVGEVLKPQGIRGEIKVKAFTDTADDLCLFKRVFLDGVEYKVLRARVGDGCAFLSLRGVPDRNAAELLRGKKVTVPRDEAPELPAGSYYIADLLGSEVFTQNGQRLGVLKEIRQAATDIYTIDTGEKEVMFPLVQGLVTEVDVAGGKIVVDEKRYKEVAVL